MLKYLLKRILLFIPTLIVISLLAFIISRNAPGDPVQRLLNVPEEEGALNGRSLLQQQQRKEVIHRLGLDLPTFYFSITPLSFPDTLYKFTDREQRNAIVALLNQSGNWRAVAAYQKDLKQLNEANDHLGSNIEDARFSKDEIGDAISRSRFTCKSLLPASDPGIVRAKMKELACLYGKYSFLSPLALPLVKAAGDYDEMEKNRQCWKNWIPAFHFYPNNQYEQWLFGDGNSFTAKGSVNSRGLIRGDFGYSYISRMPVSMEIGEHIGWSLFFTILSVLLAYLVSIPIGIRAARKRGFSFDHLSSIVLFTLYSLPSFWVATLLLMTFANPDVINIFPASGVRPVQGFPPGSGFWEQLQSTLPYLILPLIAYTYSSIAFLSRIMRASMLEVLNQDFIRTARAKGLSERKVISKHAFRNAVLPLITVLADIFPIAIGGSIILESVFTIPGMGLETFQAIQSQDYPVIVGVFTLTGIMTLIGYLVADILYAWADPRITFSKGGS